MDEKRNKICGEITDDILLDYAENAVSGAMRAKIETHLGECAGCKRRAEEMGLLKDALKNSGEDIPIPESVDKAVYKAIESISASQTRKPRISRTLRWLIPAAACLLVAVTAGIIFFSRTTREYAKQSPPAMTPSQVYLPSRTASAPPGVTIDDAGKVKITELNKKILSLQEELSKEKDKTETLTKLLDGKNGEVRDLSKALDGMREQSEESGKKLTELEEKVNMLLSSTAILQNQVSEANATIKNLNEELQKSAQTSSKQSAQIAKLLAEQDALKNQLIVRGDVTGDKKVDVSDAFCIVNNLLSGENISVSPEGDANGDGVVDVGDALMILNKNFAE